MERFTHAHHVALAVCMFGFAACSSGGGGGSPASTPVTQPVVTPPVGSTADAAQQASLGGTPFPQADASTAAFTGNLPTSNISFPLLQSVMQVDTSKVTSIDLTGGATLTRTGTTTVSNKTAGVYDLKIPGLNVAASGVLADGSLTTLSDGRKVSATFAGLNYSLLGTWAVTPAQGGANTAYFGMAVSGYQTPGGALPSIGSATYVGNSSSGAGAGGVVGALFVASGSAIQHAATLQGNASMTVSFFNNTVTGTLSDMTTTDIFAGVTSPWNSVNLSGNLVGVNVLGNTTTSSATGALAFDGSSKGTFNGSLFGPKAEEAAAVWSLHDNTGGGKTAVGMFAATKQ